MSNKRVKFGFLGTLVLCIGMLPGPVSAQNLLDNPGFETGIPPWFCFGCTLTQSDAQARSGDWSVLAEQRTEVFHGPVQSMADKLSVGRSYRLSAWVYLPAGAPQPFRILVAQEDEDDGAPSFIRLVEAEVAAGQWTQLAGTFTLEASAPLTRLDMYIAGPAPGVDYYADDLAVDPLPDNLLDNPGFEDGAAPWFCFGCTLTRSDVESRSGDWSVLAEQRTEIFHGPVQSLPAKLEIGRSYRLSAWVRLPAGDPQSFGITVAVQGEDDTAPSFRRVATREVAAGPWTELSGIYTLEAGSPLTRFDVYVEGPEPGLDFYADDLAVELLPEDWEVEADARIDALRKRDVSVTVLGADDQPLQGAQVRLRMLERAFPFGMVMAYGPFRDEPKYREYIAERFNWAVHENEAKWYANERNRDQVSYAQADAMLDWADGQGIRMRGHTIFWAPEQWQPDWAKPLTGSELEAEVTDRLESVVTHFRGRFRHWDVNNEMLHGSFFRDRLGDDIVPWMFERTKAIDPDARLFVNDFNVVSNGTRADEYVDQIQGFLDAGLPIGGIGVQGHFQGVDPLGVLSRFDKLTAFDLPVWVTEFDVVQADEDDRADHLEWFLRAAFSHPAVDGIVLWGFWEGSHWRGPDAALVNQDWTLNAAGQRLDELLEAWSSDETRVSDTAGIAEARVFHGRYQLEVTAPDGKRAVRTLRVPPGEPPLAVTVSLESILSDAFEGSADLQ
ncbi:MAG: endo-1,4-beta-xylanase [Xanthomonadales bacterium]|jgi:GH35 family endo-1,4-beta-xylanase|nr:endo-1,4-beta-xylanase [Xanthomonadales bacterium]